MSSKKLVASKATAPAMALVVAKTHAGAARVVSAAAWCAGWEERVCLEQKLGSRLRTQTQPERAEEKKRLVRRLERPWAERLQQMGAV